MSSIKQLIHEIHRRSLWQVLGIFLAASWLVLQVVEVLTETAGLPDWTPSMALVLLLVGLPICLATAFVQEGLPGTHDEPAPSPHPDATENLAAGTGSLDRPSTRPSGVRRLLTWKNAFVGGGAAAGLLGLSVAGYFFLWSSGIGPVGNLVAQGVIEEGVRVVLADFDDATGEGLGAVVTDALRVDLGEAAVLELLDREGLDPALERMQLPPSSPISAATARELAIREGIGVVLEGAVSSAGSGYVLTAALVEAQSGRTAASFRVTAADDSGIIDAIDRLSQDIREKSGESLRDIRAGEPLSLATTSSLEALSAFSEAMRLLGTDQSDRRRDLLEEAIAADSTFASAWLYLAFHLRTRGQEQERAQEAMEAAHRHRVGLNDVARYYIEGSHAEVTNDRDGAIAAFKQVLTLDPDHAGAQNQLANIYTRIGQREEARDLYRQALAAGVYSPGVASNLIRTEMFLGSLEVASQELQRLEGEAPGYFLLPTLKINLALILGATDRADSIAFEILNDAAQPPDKRMQAAIGLGKVSLRRGRFAASRAYFDQATEIAAEVDLGLAALTALEGVTSEMMLGGPPTARDRLVDLLTRDDLPLEFWPGEAVDGVVIMLGFGGVSYEEAADLLGGERAPEVAREALARQRGFFGGAPEELAGSVGEFQDAFACTTEHCSKTLRGYAAGLQGDWETAIALRESSVGKDGEFVGAMEDLAAMFALGSLYEGAGRTEEAIAAYQRAIDLWADADEEGMVFVRDFQSRIERLRGR